MPKTKITDESDDRKYFTLTPQIVWALSRDTYDYTLWNVIKMIAGDNGECILGTDDLATMAMMSAGKVSNCRKYLLSVGLIQGELRKDPGYPQPVWHLTIPDLWKKNVEWRTSIGDELKSRLEIKRQQKEDKKSLHQVKPSSGERGTSPDEKGIPPDETKDIHKEKQKEEPIDLPSAENQLKVLFPKGLAGIEDQLRDIERSSWHIRGDPMRNALAIFLKVTGLAIPQDSKTRKHWAGSLGQHIENYGSGKELERLYVATKRQMDKQELTICRPSSMTNMMVPEWPKINNPQPTDDFLSSPAPLTYAPRAPDPATRLLDTWHAILGSSGLSADIIDAHFRRPISVTSEDGTLKVELNQRAMFWIDAKPIMAKRIRGALPRDGISRVEFIDATDSPLRLAQEAA